jgi:hypothetical protein
MAGLIHGIEVPDSAVVGPMIPSMPGVSTHMQFNLQRIPPLQLQNVWAQLMDRIGAEGGRLGASVSGVCFTQLPIPIGSAARVYAIAIAK